MGGQHGFKYWNDHLSWWWPMADGGDQGDTAGLQFSYNLEPHALSAGSEAHCNNPSQCQRLVEVQSPRDGCEQDSKR